MKKSVLATFCRECISNKDFTGFFTTLDQRLEVLIHQDGPRATECQKWCRKTKSTNKNYESWDQSDKKHSLAYDLQTSERMRTLERRRKTKRAKTLTPLNYHTVE
jgi:predicted sulfurtransferase